MFDGITAKPTNGSNNLRNKHQRFEVKSKIFNRDIFSSCGGYKTRRSTRISLGFFIV
jgi:hypothetical protein